MRIPWRLIALFVVGGCGSGATGVGDGGIGDAGHDAGVRERCDGLPSGSDAARASEEEVAAELAAEGFAPLAPARMFDFSVYRVDRAGLADGDPAPILVGSEEEILARPDGDGLRSWYERESPAIEWATQSLLVYFFDEPFTDVALFAKGDDIVLVSTHLAGCVPPEDPNHPPRERLRRGAAVVPRAARVTARVREVRYALRHFPLEPGFERVPDGPLLRRNAGNASVARVGDRWHIWAEGYSGATGMMFHGTSPDGLAWDFRWDDPYLLVFEGLGTFPDVFSPSVVAGPEALHMFLTIADGEPFTPGIHRASSTDGVEWTDIRPVDMGCGLYGQPYVHRDGDLLHAWAQSRSLTRISHSVSADEGLTWTCEDDAVLERGGPDDFDGQGLYHPAVVRVGGRWIMFYVAAYGFREPYRAYLAYATSDDGSTFTRGAPVLAQNLEPGHWESGLSGHLTMGRPLPIVRGADTWLYYGASEGGEPSVGLAIARSWTPSAP